MFHFDLSGVFAIVVVSMCVLAPLVGLVVQLLVFHFHLYLNNMTTYEFIMDQSRRASESRKAAAAAKADAASAASTELTVAP
jgi:hypothetical protein